MRFWLPASIPLLRLQPFLRSPAHLTLDCLLFFFEYSFPFRLRLLFSISYFFLSHYSLTPPPAFIALIFLSTTYDSLQFYLLSLFSLYNSLCRSVRRSVLRSVTFLNFERLSRNSSCPTVRDWIAVYPALFTSFITF